MKFLILICMIFLHIVDDYYLQGCLAKFKQKSFWEENAPNKLYKYDYIAALAAHGFSWAFMIQLPVMILIFTGMQLNIKDYCIFLVGNCISHALMDNFKANLKCVNLIQDQLFHLFQIVLTWFCLIRWGD